MYFFSSTSPHLIVYPYPASSILALLYLYPTSCLFHHHFHSFIFPLSIFALMSLVISISSTNHSIAFLFISSLPPLSGRGVVRVDVNLQDVDIDQCSTSGWFAGTHRCNLTSMEVSLLQISIDRQCQKIRSFHVTIFNLLVFLEEVRRSH